MSAESGWRKKLFAPQTLALPLGAALAWSALLFFQQGLIKERPPIDFGVFLDAGDLIRAGHSPYDDALDPRRAYVYPQAFAYLIAVPLSALSRETAILIWKCLGLAFVGFAAWAGMRWGERVEAATAFATPRKMLAMWAACMALGYSPVVFGWRLGQADLLLSALLAGVVLARGPAAPWIAGALVGLGGILKLSPLGLLPALVLAFGWRALAGALAVAAAYIAALAAGGVLGRELLLFTVRIPHHEYANGYPASSLQSFATAIFAPERFRDPSGYYHGPWTRGTTVVMCALYAVAGLALWRKRAGTFALFAVAVVFARLVSPFLEPHHHSTSVILLAGWGVAAIRAKDARLLLMCAGAWYLGSVYVPIAEVVGGRWPALLLLASDGVLLWIAFAYPKLGGESPFLLELGPFRPMKGAAASD